VKRGQWNLYDGQLLKRSGILRHVRFIGTSSALALLNLTNPALSFFAELKKHFEVDRRIVQRQSVFLDATFGKLDTQTLGNNLPNLGALKLTADAQLILWIHPDGSKQDYDAFRTAADRIHGFPSRCITEEKLSKNQGGVLACFVAKNAMKVNLRINGHGVNHTADLQQFLPPGVSLTDSMIVGGDVTHPGGSTCLGTGSVAAMVGTIDAACSVYRGCAQPNESRAEVRHATEPK
jgi:hypothetical protein